MTAVAMTSDSTSPSPTTTSAPSPAAPAASPSPTSPASDARFGDIGTSGTWARDFAILGALSTGLGLVAMGAGLIFAVVGIGAIVGAVTGLGLGAWLQRLVSRHGAALPGAVLVALGPIIGGFWGAAVGVITAVCVIPDGEIISFAAAFGAVSGVAQLAWFWVVYVALRARKLPTWPALVLAAVTPFLGGALMRALVGGGGIFGNGWR